LPGILSDRLFAVFDQNHNDYIQLKEFTDGMTLLYTGTYEQLITFIFNFYDFDNSGRVSREDIRVVLSYIPINTRQLVQQKNGLKFDR